MTTLNNDEEDFEGMGDYDTGREAPEIDPDDYDDYVAGRREWGDSDDLNDRDEDDN